MQERREFVRFRIPVLIEFPHPETCSTERSFTQDISTTGLRFPTPVQLTVGKELALTMELPFQSAAFHATGEVVWIREIARLGATQYEVGLNFRWMEEHDRQRLSNCLHNFISAKL
jgi:hypothetical protein